MKNKIALILLLVLVILLTTLSIFLGSKYLNNKNTISDMTTKSEELNTQITQLTEANTELNNKIESLSKLEEETNNDEPNITANVYYNSNNTLTLYLIEGKNAPNNFGVQNGIDRNYILIHRGTDGIIDYQTGYYYDQNGKVHLNILNHNTNSTFVDYFEAKVEENEKNGTTDLICTYDGKNILFGNQTLIEK